MYSIEKSVQILIAVLKANNIKKVIVSPGTTNISFVTSLVNDGSFEMYSAIDERGAAYIACGLASESGEAVVITCTGATASRNYYPGLTEAYHRKLPILAVTASQDFTRNGNLSPQYIDRTIQPHDSVKMSVQIPIIRDKEEEYDATLQINKAVLELTHRGGGPVHINLASSYNNNFSVDDISYVRILKRLTYGCALPPINHKRVAITIGTHKSFDEELTKCIDDFCAKYDAVVFVDHSSHYYGKYRILPTILTTQERYRTSLFDIDLLIHIGEEHGDYYTNPYFYRAKEVWRVSEDGEIRDTFRHLTNTFEMEENDFFSYYSKGVNEIKNEYYNQCKQEIDVIYQKIPNLPFSNIWIAENVIPLFPNNAVLELGVSNTMRSWTFFDFKNNTYVLANTGCRGIDGAIPTLLGMSLAKPDLVHFAVMGDLTFFYSFNVLGNRHIGNNVRIMLINNNCGTEFNLYPSRAMNIYNNSHDKINEFIGAGNHNSAKSIDIVKHYAEDIGFEYMRASNKNEFHTFINHFLDTTIKKPILFELFTKPDDENEALRLIRNIISNMPAAPKSSVVKKVVKKLIRKK